MIQQQTKLKEIYKKSETKKIKSVTTIKNYNKQNRLHKKVDKTTGTLDCLKTSIFNQLMLNGNKQTSEKLLLKSLKKLQKEDIKKKKQRKKTHTNQPTEHKQKTNKKKQQQQLERNQS
eukprot:257348_1